MSRTGIRFVFFGLIIVSYCFEGLVTGQSDYGQCGLIRRKAKRTESYLYWAGYPQKSRNLFCKWTMEASEDHVVRLRSFAQLSNCVECKCDYLTAYDGSDINNKSSIIKKWCGYTNLTVYSPGRTLTLTFRAYGPSAGYYVKYSQVLENCGGNLAALNFARYLTSPEYPSVYPDRVKCIWLINSSSSERIRLKLVDVDIRSQKNCNDDFILVFNGLNAAARRLGKFCSSDVNKTTYISLGSQVRVELHTDSVGYGRGFRLQYTSGTLRFTNHTDLKANALWNAFQSPDYPNHYPNLVDYTWRIQSLYTICVDTVHFDVEKNSGCRKDYVELFDGESEQTKSLGQWCGKNSFHVCSSGQYLFIKFHADLDRSGGGFKIRYSQTYRHTEPGERRFSFPGWPIIGSLVGIISVLMLLWCRCRYLRRRQNTRQTALHTTVGISDPTHSPAEVPVIYSIPQDQSPPPPTFANGPPSYNDVIKSDLEHGNSPPSYESLGIN